MWKYSVIIAAAMVCAAGALAAPEGDVPASTDETAAMEEAKPQRPVAKAAREEREPGRESKGAGLRGGFDAAEKNDDGKLSFEEAQAQWPRLSEERFKALDMNDDGFISRDEAPRPPANRSRDGGKAPQERTEMKAPKDGDGARPASRRPGAGGENWQRLKGADTDDDGIVSREEWQAAFGENRMERFEVLRGDSEEGVRLEALRARIAERGRGAQGGNRMDPEARRAYLGRLIETLDTDENSEVSWEEFQAGRPGLPRQAFDRMDSSKDGVLSEADLATP